MNKKLYKLMDWAAIEGIVYSEEDHPEEILGAHSVVGTTLIQTFIPDAKEVSVCMNGAEKKIKMDLADEEGFYACTVTGKGKKSYQYEVTFLDGEKKVLYDPYNYVPTLPHDVIEQMKAGILYDAYEYMGAHLDEMDGVEGVTFRVWAPNAMRVSLVGEFNGWDGRVYPMIREEETGCFVLFVPGLTENTPYKYEIKKRSGEVVVKADPYSRLQMAEHQNASVVCKDDVFAWTDSAFMKARDTKSENEGPISIYEINMREFVKGDEPVSYIKVMKTVLPHVKKMGYTHVELLPVVHHLDVFSNGYKASSYYATCSDYGTQAELKEFVNTLHKEGIGVLLDWVPSFFPRETDGLESFDGTYLYGHLDIRQRENKAYNAYNFNYGRPEVSNYLLANAIYWIDKFHFDGLRLSGLSSMLYMDYGKQDGEWTANIYGGNENLDAIEFIKHLNSILHIKFKGILTIAKETSAWPKLTDPLDKDGMGFDYVWNTGFMQDFLSYIGKDEPTRNNSLRDLTFSMVYAYSENYIMALSHNEVYRNGGSVCGLIKEADADRFALYRAVLTFMMTRPGKKMIFMGQDYGHLATEEHKIPCIPEGENKETYEKNLKFFEKINSMYLKLPALFENDRTDSGFEWLRCIDHGDGILCFMRKTRYMEDALLVVGNFSSEAYPEYKFGVPYEGKYKEIFNSSDKTFGGKATLKKASLNTDDEGYDGHEFSLSLSLQPMSVSVYAYEPFSEEELLKMAEKKAEEIQEKLRKEAKRKAEELKKISVRETLETKINDAAKKIASGTEKEKEVKSVKTKAKKAK